MSVLLSQGTCSCFRPAKLLEQPAQLEVIYAY
jgi:hypothetical protein